MILNTTVCSAASGLSTEQCEAEGPFAPSRRVLLQVWLLRKCSEQSADLSAFNTLDLLSLHRAALYLSHAMKSSKQTLSEAHDE